jgi:hypothetical protein
MTKFKGTKGKWFVSGGDKYATIQSSNMDEKIVVTHPTIATINSTFIDIEEFRANALLISKSKEMLKELENIVDCWDKNVFQELDIDAIRQLIKQSTDL